MWICLFLSYVKKTLQEPCESPTEADHRPVPIPHPVPVTVPVPATVAALDEDTGAVPRKRKVE